MPAYASTWWGGIFSCWFSPSLFLQQHVVPAGLLNTRAQTCKDVLMPWAISGIQVRFPGLLKWLGGVVSWQHLQKAMPCLNLLSCFLSVRLFSQSRESDHCAKCRPKYLFSKHRTFVLLRQCQVNLTGYRSFLKVNKTRSTFTSPGVGVGPSGGLGWSPFTGYRDVSLNTQVFISSKSTQTDDDGNRNKVHICQFTSLSEQDYFLCVTGCCTDVPSRGTAASLPWGLSLSLSFLEEEISHQFIFYSYIS